MLLFTGLACRAQIPSAGQLAEPNLVWGVNSACLEPALEDAASLENLLKDQGHTLSLSRFYREGGENTPATPTECRVACSAEKLFVIFRCTETNLDFPEVAHGVDWYSQLRSPVEQDAAFPDKVDLFLSMDMNQSSCCQFTATLDGQKFGCKRHPGRAALTPDDQIAVVPGTDRIQAFEASVTRTKNEWVVFFQIPWKTLGGKPASNFGLLPMRTRWRNGEVSSPVAADFGERPPPDLFIETHFSKQAAETPAQACLCRLPSGTLRWQRPALLAYPGPEIRQQIWRLEQSLTQPTGQDNLALRIQLTQRWFDLLALEGFNLEASRGSIVEEDLTAFVIRRSVNTALRRHDVAEACRLLDAYLHKLDQVSRKWFADTSPGDMLREEWKPITEVQSCGVSRSEC